MTANLWQWLTLLLSIFAYAGYLVYLTGKYYRWWKDDSRTVMTLCPKELSVVNIILMINALFLYFHLFVENGISMHLFDLLAITFWLMLIVVVILYKRSSSVIMVSLLMLLNFLNFTLILIFPVGKAVVVNDFTIVGHGTLSIVAYGFSLLVALQGLLFSWQERQLRQKKLFKYWMGVSPSLEKNEWLFFRFVQVAFIFLTLSLISGAIVLNDWFEQQVSHKIVFTIIAWLIFAVLLMLKQFSKWHIQQSANWALFACFLLMIGVVGSKIVLEYIL